MPRSYVSTLGPLSLSAPELYIDNQARRRSGHMSHAMLEYAHGKLMAFNFNCSALSTSTDMPHTAIRPQLYPFGTR